MNKDITASGYLSKDELKFYFTHWGLSMTNEEFEKVYDYFDIDKDGKISYFDFNKAVGPEIHPGETLYFR
jgi:Ca2+-binding EF-hand superfamily protein